MLTLRRYILIPTLISFLSITARAESEPHWELGLGLGGLSIPHYRGSDQQKEYVAPIPYVQYEGKRLQVDREGGRFYLYKGDKLWLDVSTSVDLPVDSKDNRARQGMPDLKPVFEIGPRAQYDLYTNQDKTLRLRIAFPLHMAIATNIRQTRNIGLVFSPYLQLRYYSGWENSLSLGPIFASETYHDYYYQVDPEYATTGRPAYDAKAGYSGFRFTLTASRRFEQRYWVGVFLRYDTLNGAVFADSPLVKQNDSLMLGLAFAYIFTSQRN